MATLTATADLSTKYICDANKVAEYSKTLLIRFLQKCPKICQVYKPDCDSNDYELPSEQATPSTLAKGVACGRGYAGYK